MPTRAKIPSVKRAKPCNVPCPMCGSDDIHRTYRSKGDEIGYPSDGSPGRSSQYVKREWMDWRVLSECIVHHCRTCQFYWDSPVLARTKPPKDPASTLRRIRD